MDIRDENYKYFMKGYNVELNERNVILYGILITLLAASGTFYEPAELKIIDLKNRLNENMELLVERFKSA